MNNKALTKVCYEFCTGCGLCGSVNGKHFSEDEKGFLYPDLQEGDMDLCSLVCPASGYAVNHYSTGSIWGEIISSYLGWSSDSNIRMISSSGGIISTICRYLLKNGLVDGVIQTRKDFRDPRRTTTVVCQTEDELFDCAGSRYTSSSPLMHIRDSIISNKRYAFVGKPCDVSALRMLMNYGNENWTKQIVYLLSFFCAGQSSLAANNILLSRLGCTDVSSIESFSYRGNGWPGMTRVVLKDGRINEIEYEKSWMEILGRDVRKSCRFCADSTGEMADISCGDAWVLSHDDKPDFSERPGRNVVFSRTMKGDGLLNELIKKGEIVVNDFDSERDRLKKIQPYHYNRKSSLSSIKAAMSLCGRRFPLYNKGLLKQYASGYPLKDRILRFAGTIVRIWNKSI